MRKNNILNWIKLSSFIFALSSLFASCSNELDEALQPANNGTLQFVVSDFPAFGEEPQTRASSLGTPDTGKTAWETNDKITVIFTSEYYGEQTATLTYNGSAWTSSGTLSYLENEIPVVSAVYNPCADTPGLGEYLTTTDCTLANNALSINFEDATRTYSRLRISTLADLPLAVTTTGFTPAGAEEAGEHSYTITADKKGNAYLYGTFAAGASVTVTSGDMTMAKYTFDSAEYENGTVNEMSYALQAGLIIDGTFGGKAEVTDKNEITALVNTIQNYVESGGNAVIVTGSQPTMITVDNVTMTAIGEAIYRLSGNGAYDENNPYNGKIDLVLPDVTEIVAMEFYAAFALNSITLPKVTTVGNGAFTGCYYLKKMTFGSVVTSINQSNSYVFYEVGKEVDGGSCDLVLNREQVNAEADYQPNIETRTWWNTEWKSITLK